MYYTLKMSIPSIILNDIAPIFLFFFVGFYLGIIKAYLLNWHKGVNFANMQIWIYFKVKYFGNGS